jgi:uncharacterized protein YkwD
MAYTARSHPALRRLPVALAIAFALGAAGLVATPASTFGWSAGTFSSASEQQLVALTNQARANAGRRALKVDSALTSIARWRSKDMIDRNYFSHAIPPSGKSVFAVMSERGYCFNLAGENIGWNTYPDDVATAQIQQMFMNSPSHRENIMGRAWDVIGVGAYKGADGKKMWTVLFADKCGTVASSTPKPTPRPTTRPKATPRPTPKPTVRPAATSIAAPAVTPSPTATASPAPTPAPRVPEPSTDLLTPPTSAVADSLRVEPPPGAPALFDAIVGDAVGVYFGSD